MKIKQLRQLTGLTQKKFSERFKIPLRTVQNWESGTNTPPEYIPRLIEMQMILENENDQLRSGQQTIKYTTMTDEEIETIEEIKDQWDNIQEELQQHVNKQVEKNRKIWKMKEFLKKMKKSLEEIDIEEIYCENCVHGKECNYDYNKCEYYQEHYRACDCIENWIYWEDLERMIEE